MGKLFGSFPIFSYLCTKKNKTLTINKFPYDISPVTANLQLDFNPMGRTNNDANYKTFTYTGQGGYTTTMTVSEGFD